MAVVQRVQRKTLLRRVVQAAEQHMKKYNLQCNHGEGGSSSCSVVRDTVSNGASCSTSSIIDRRLLHLKANVFNVLVVATIPLSWIRILLFYS